jgi:hypothetical protein
MLLMARSTWLGYKAPAIPLLVKYLPAACPPAAASSAQHSLPDLLSQSGFL